MNAKNLKRLESAWLLRDFAWALKRYADRIERCCTQNPNDENEAKAQQRLDRARERMQKFRASRAEYLHIDTINGISPTSIWVDELTQKRNPWRAGFLPLTNRVGVVKVFFGPGEIETWDVRQGGIFTHIGEHDPFRKCGTRPLAWRPA